MSNFDNNKIHKIIDEIEKSLLSLDMQSSEFHLQRALDYCKRFDKLDYKQSIANSYDRIKTEIMVNNI